MGSWQPDSMWEARGACKALNLTPATFYGVNDSGPMLDVEVERAKRVCAVCPVNRECLLTALAMNEGWGVWGGRTVQDRKRIVNEHGSTAAAMQAIASGTVL
jgi:WhiB family redox-sensing transcriptional regulator